MDWATEGDGREKACTLKYCTEHQGLFQQEADEEEHPTWSNQALLQDGRWTSTRAHSDIIVSQSTVPQSCPLLEYEYLIHRLLRACNETPAYLPTTSLRPKAGRSILQGFHLDTNAALRLPPTIHHSCSSSGRGCHLLPPPLFLRLKEPGRL